MIKHLCYLIYGVTSTVESVINLFLYLTFLYKLVPVCDFSLNLHFWLTDKLLKKGYLKSLNGNGKDF